MFSNRQEILKGHVLMRETEQGNKPPLNINIPIEWHIPENLTGQYASNVFMQAGEYEVVIYFFQTQLPLLTGTPEENKATLEQLKTVGVYAGVATANRLRMVTNLAPPPVAEEANDDEVIALFDELEPYYRRTNQMLANL